MSTSYSQLRAMLAITKASLRAVFRSPSAVIFSLAFPLVFILVFGFIGGGAGRIAFRVAFDPGTDTSTTLYQALQFMTELDIVSGEEQDLNERLAKGRLEAM